MLEQVLQSVEEFSTSCMAETERVCGALHAELERAVTKTMEAVAVPRHDTGSGAAHAQRQAAEVSDAAQSAEAQKVQLLHRTTQAELARLEAALADARTTVGHRTGRLQTTLVEVLRLWPITPSEARTLLSIIDPSRKSIESAGDMGIDPADRERLLGVSRQALVDVLSSAKFKHAIEAIFKLSPLQELEHAIPIAHAAISAVRRAGLLVEVARASQSERAQRQQAANELKLEIMELEVARTKLLDQAEAQAADFGELLRHLVAVQVVANIRDYAARHSDAQTKDKGAEDTAMDAKAPQRPKSKPKRKTKSKAADRIGPSPVGLVVDEKAQQSSSIYRPERKHNLPTPKPASPSLTSTVPSHPPTSPAPADPSLVGRQSLAEQAAAALKAVQETKASDGSNAHPAIDPVGDGSPAAVQKSPVFPSGGSLEEQVKTLLEEREATRRQLDVEKAQVKAAVQDLRQRLAQATQAATKWQALADQRGSEIARLTAERCVDCLLSVWCQCAHAVNSTVTCDAPGMSSSCLTPCCGSNWRQVTAWVKLQSVPHPRSLQQALKRSHAAPCMHGRGPRRSFGSHLSEAKVNDDVPRRWTITIYGGKKSCICTNQHMNAFTLLSLLQHPLPPILATSRQVSGMCPPSRRVGTT